MKKTRQYHRNLGILLSLPLLWLCLTGLLLNHAPELKLDQRLVTSRTLLSPYLKEPTGQPTGIQVGTRLVSQWDEYLFLDQQILPFSGNLIGAIPLRANLLIATSDYLYLLGPNAELLDQLDEASLPETPITALRLDPNPSYSSASHHFTFDGELLSFEQIQLATPNATSETLRALQPTEIKELAKALASQTPVSYYRVLLDLHKFSPLGGFGKWLLTLSTLGLIALLFSGLGLFRRFRKKQHSNSSS